MGACQVVEELTRTDKIELLHDVMADVLGASLSDAESIVNGLEESGYGIEPQACAQCDRWLETRCAVHGVIS